MHRRKRSTKHIIQIANAITHYVGLHYQNIYICDFAGAVQRLDTVWQSDQSKTVN